MRFIVSLMLLAVAMVASAANVPLSTLGPTQDVGWSQSTATGVLALPNGECAAPSGTFMSDRDTGLALLGPNNIGFCVQGFRGMDLAADRLNLNVHLGMAGNVIYAWRNVVQAVTSDSPIVVGGNTTNTDFTNTGASGEVIVTLPEYTLAAGQSYLFVVTTASQYLRVKAPSGWVIYDGTSATSDGGYIRSNAKGSVLRVWYSGADWYVLTKIGTWTRDS